MSEASERGKSYEIKIQKLTARALKIEVKRDPRSGGGTWHKEDIRDRYGELPISVEIKNQATIKLKEWWKNARDKASVGQAPIVVFPADTEDLCIMRYSDLLNIVKEMFDYRETAEALTSPRTPDSTYVTGELEGEFSEGMKEAVDRAWPGVIKTPTEARAKVATLPARKYCPAGHAVPEGRGKCLQKGCQYSATYRKPKEARK